MNGIQCVGVKEKWKMSNFLKNVIKETGNEYGTIVSDGLATADVSG